ncbi:MAG: TonB-dependent receptor [Treponema sp.]|nr:TonB-dependent receptor [Treponema sp.]
MKHIRYLTSFIVIFCSTCFAQEVEAPYRADGQIAEGGQVVENPHDAADSQGAGSGSDAEQSIYLPHIYAYIDSPVVEQREVLTASEIEQLHAESLPELFTSMGIQTLSYGAYGSQSNPSIRGFTGPTVRVVVDGVAMNSAQNGNFDFSSINPASIEKIEVVRGGFVEDLAGEGAVGGVVYITTKSQSLGQHFSAGLGAKTYFNANVPLDTAQTEIFWNGQTGENTFLKAGLNGTFAQNRFLYTNYMGNSREQIGAQVTDGNADIGVTHFFGNGNSFTISDLFYAGCKHISNGKGIQQDYNNSATVGVSIPAADVAFLPGEVKLNGSLSWKSSNEWYGAGHERSIHHLNEVKTDFFARTAIFPWFVQSAGLHLEADVLDSSNTGKHMIFAGTFKETSKIFLGDFVSLSVPLALLFSNQNVSFVPKLGVKFDLPFADLLLDAYRMAAFPTMNQLYWQGTGASGNKNLSVESGWGAEFTLNSKKEWFPISLCVFMNYYENSIHWGVQDGLWTPLNMRSAFYAGVDVMAKKTLWRILTVRGSFEYLYNRLLDKSNSATYGKMIMYTPDIVASASAMLSLSWFSIMVEASYTGKRYEDNQNIYVLDPYLILNISAELKLCKYAKPYVRVDNLLDVDYEAVPNYPMPGISITIGLRAVW